MCQLASERDISMKNLNFLIESFVYSYSNYFPLIWHFCKTRSLQEIEHVQKQDLQHFCEDFKSGCSKSLQKSNKSLQATQKLRLPCTEIYKILNQLIPGLMSDIFKLLFSNRAARKRQVLNLETKRPNQVKFGEKSLKVLGPKISHHISSLQKIFRLLKISLSFYF